MLNNRQKKVVAIIPVRAGSKGIPGKNLLKIGKDSILERTIKMAERSEYIDKILVSTDSPEMYEIAKKYGVHTKSLRSAELANDTASTIDVLEYTANEEGLKGYEILLLQVTTPLRTISDLNEFLSEYDKHSDFESSVSLVHHDAPHPDKIQKIENGKVVSYLGKESMVARQLLPKVYSLNGAFYIRNEEGLFRDRSYFSNSTLPYIMSSDKSVNLDTKWDRCLLEYLIEKKEIELEEYN